MYLQSGFTFPVADVRQMVEIHHFQRCMEERHYMQVHGTCKSVQRLAMSDQTESKQSKDKPITSFSIRDILSGCNRDKQTESGGSHTDSDSEKYRINSPSSNSSSSASETVEETNPRLKLPHNRPAKILHRNNLNTDRKIVRPWSSTPKPSSRNSEKVTQMCKDFTKSSCRISSNYDPDTDEEEEIDVEGCDDDESDISLSGSDRDISPLDALMAMSSKAFIGLENFENQRNNEEVQHDKSQISKKKRKTRTAFTNQQIYELEKRFIIQKYLTPVDRDELASKLGLTCPQVITWFQNRRAKFKRDIEELKNDVVATSPKEVKRLD